MTGRRLAGAALVALLLVVAAEVSARVVAPHLPEPLLWSDRTTQLKHVQMAHRARAGCTDVVFVGNSMTRDGLDPEVLVAEGAARRPYNAALDAAAPRLSRRWLDQEVLDTLDPEAVIVGLTSFDLNDEARITTSALDGFDTAPFSRDDPLGRMQAAVMDRSALMRHRAELRDPETLRTGIADWRDGLRAERLGPDGIEGLIAPDGLGLSRRELQYTGSPAAQRLVRQELLNDFSMGGSESDALAGLLDDLRGRGIDTTVVLLPVTDDYRALHPEGDEDFERFVDVATDLVEASGARLIDLHGSAEDEWFADTHHLNGEGSERITAAVAAELGDEFVSGACE